MKEGLYEALKNFVKKNPEYKSVADFVTEAARTRMQELEKFKLQKEAAKHA